MKYRTKKISYELKGKYEILQVNVMVRIASDANIVIVYILPVEDI